MTEGRTIGSGGMNQHVLPWTGLVPQLHTQHETAMARLATLDATLGDGGIRDATAQHRARAAVEAVLAYLDHELATHIREEEEVLFPRLRGAVPPWDQHLIDQVVAGHDEIRRKRDAMFAAAAGGTAQPSPTGLQRMEQAARDLLQTVLTHIENEEDLVLPLASQVAGTGSVAATALPVIALARAAELLHGEGSWRRGDRRSTTLVDLPGLRVVLTAMQGGARLALHETTARFTLQVLSGRLAIAVRDHSAELPPGALLALDRNIPHDVEALVDSAFLLSLVGPRSVGA